MPAPIKIAIAGALGRMGRALTAAVDADAGLELVARFDRPGAEDVQWAVVGVVHDVHDDVPAGHHPVEQPAAGEPDDAHQVGCDDVEPLPQELFAGGANCWVRDCA